MHGVYRARCRTDGGMKFLLVSVGIVLGAVLTIGAAAILDAVEWEARRDLAR